jgi:hypothetical protein
MRGWYLAMISGERAMSDSMVDFILPMGIPLPPRKYAKYSKIGT